MMTRSVDSAKGARSASALPSGLLRLGLIGLCGLLIVAALGSYRAWQRNRSELVRILGETGVDQRNEQVLGRIERERTAHHAQVLAARALIYDVLSGEVADTGDGTPRLAAVGELAREVLRAQPNSWQGAMLLGAATYLERSLARDRRLVTAAADWEAPLRQAVATAHGQPEPRRFLAAAYLEVWPYLSAAKKDFARGLLKEAFAADPEGFRRLLPAWLAVAADLDEAFAPIPDRPEAWELLARGYAERRQWELFCAVRGRRLDALERQLERTLEQAEARLRLGDFYRARSLLLQVISTAPRDLRFAPLVTRALKRYPAGLHGLASTERLREWLRWALELHEVAVDPLPPPIIGRLAGVAGELAPPEAALAALIGGEIHHAERLERLTDTLSVPPWGPYLIAKTHWLLDRDQPHQAAAMLDRADAVTRRKVPYYQARERVALARGDLVEVAEARRQLTESRAREWPPLAWQQRDQRSLLYLLAEGPAEGLIVALHRVAATGVVVQLRWDGRTVLMQPVFPGQEVELGVKIDRKPHLLELRTLAGEPVYPGRVRLRGNVRSAGPASSGPGP